MKLSHSVRVAEKFHSKREPSAPLEQLAGAVAESGYHAICMRASQIGNDTPKDAVEEGLKLLHRLGLKVSMVTGDFPIPENTDEAPEALRNITPHVDLAEALGADLIRIGMKLEEDIPWAQRAADEARERGINLAHQSHAASLFETVEGSLQVLKQVGRENFGIIYEPANLEACGEHYGPKTIKAFEPYLFNVYLQNQRLGPRGETSMETWARGDVRFDQIPIWEADGIDYPSIMDALGELGYDGYVTIHQASVGLPLEETIREGATYLRSIGSFDARP